MAELLPVPEVAAGATEVVVAEWLVKAGDSFAAGDVIAVIETEKAVVEFPAEKAGTLLRPLVTAGAEAEVGSPMALVGSVDEVEADIDTLLSELGVGADTTDAPSADAPPADAVPADALRVETPGPAEEEAYESEESVELPRAGVGGGRLFISPIARKLLREAGLSPQDVSGTGPHGRIRRRDVEATIAARSERSHSGTSTLPTVTTTPAPPRTVSTTGTEIPHSRLRRAVAARLTQSKQQTPHFYVRRTVQLDALLALRTTVNEDSPVRISVNDLLIKAIGVAHTQVPDANVIWTDDAMRQFDTVEVAVAIASDKGLVTPVLRDVQGTSVSGIARQVRTFVEQANAGRLQQQDLEGGSITISNLGMYDVDEFSAIINPPQSAILAVGAGKPSVVVQDGQPAVVTAANLVLSVDHRAIDGALAAQWMNALVEAVQRPMRLFI